MGLNIAGQIFYLLVLAIPIACISWTATHEEIFREGREFLIQKSKTCKRLLYRKFYYIFTCEYCFSHYVTIVFLLISKFTLLFSDWRGYIISGFSLVWIANIYMSLYGRLRVDIKAEQTETALKQEEIEEKKKD